MFNFIQAHAADAVAAGFAVSVIVSGMPEPTPTDSPWYVWTYHVAHLLVADWSYIFGSRTVTK